MRQRMHRCRGRRRSAVEEVEHRVDVVICDVSASLRPDCQMLSVARKEFLGRNIVYGGVLVDGKEYVRHARYVRYGLCKAVPLCCRVCKAGQGYMRMRSNLGLPLNMEIFSQQNRSCMLPQKRFYAAL
jgi:hypothetical protein